MSGGRGPALADLTFFSTSSTDLAPMSTVEMSGLDNTIRKEASGSERSISSKKS